MAVAYVRFKDLLLYEGIVLLGRCFLLESLRRRPVSRE